MKKNHNRGETLLKISHLFAGILSLVLIVNANSTTCLFIHQPEEPKEVERFKFIK